MNRPQGAFLCLPPSPSLPLPLPVSLLSLPSASLRCVLSPSLLSAFSLPLPSSLPDSLPPSLPPSLPLVACSRSLPLLSLPLRFLELVQASPERPHILSHVSAKLLPTPYPSPTQALVFFFHLPPSSCFFFSRPQALLFFTYPSRSVSAAASSYQPLVP